MTVNPCSPTRACINLLPYFSLKLPPFDIANNPVINTATTPNMQIKAAMRKIVFMSLE